MTYQPGDTARVSTTFTVGGTATDPDTVSLIVTAPSGTATTYTYPADITKTATGAYRRDIGSLVSGLYAWRWVGTGAAAGTDEGSFTVERSLPAETLASIDVVKLRMETDVTTSDDVLQRILVGASMAVQLYIGRRIRPLDATASDRYFEATDAWDPGRRELWVWDLSTTPTEVEILDSDGSTLSTLTVATDLLLYPRNRRPWEPVERIRLRPSATAPVPGNEVRVRGIWGWPAVPEDIVDAVVDTVRSRLRQAPIAPDGYDDFGSRPVGPMPSGGWMLPMSAKQTLAPYRRPLVG
jgi:hypothetical protein